MELYFYFFLFFCTCKIACEDGDFSDVTLVREFEYCQHKESHACLPLTIKPGIVTSVEIRLEPKSCQTEGVQGLKL